MPLLAGRSLRDSDSVDPPRSRSSTSRWPRSGAARIPSDAASRLPAVRRATWITVVGIAGDFRLYGADTEIRRSTTCRTPERASAAESWPHRRPAVPTSPVHQDAVHAVERGDAGRGVADARRAAQRPAGRPGLTAALLVDLRGDRSGHHHRRHRGPHRDVRQPAYTRVRRADGARRQPRVGAQTRALEGFVLVLVGLALGIGGAYAFSQLITGFLFETTATDIMAYAATARCSSRQRSSRRSGRHDARRQSIRSPRFAPSDQGIWGSGDLGILGFGDLGFVDFKALNLQIPNLQIPNLREASRVGTVIARTRTIPVRNLVTPSRGRPRCRRSSG